MSLIVKEFEENDLNLAKLQTRVYCIVFMPPPPVLCTANGILFSTGPRVLCVHAHQRHSLTGLSSTSSFDSECIM